jgi:hypothetical protein
MLRDFASDSWREIEGTSFALGDDLRRFWRSVELLVRMSECAYRVAGAVGSESWSLMAIMGHAVLWEKSQCSCFVFVFVWVRPYLIASAFGLM